MPITVSVTIKVFILLSSSSSVVNVALDANG